MIESIEDAFNRRYSTEPKKIKKKNVIREIMIRTLLAVIFFVIFYNLNSLSFSVFSLNIDNKTIAIVLSLINFLPLIFLKKSNKKVIKKVEKEIEKKNNLIKKIETELSF